MDIAVTPPWALRNAPAMDAEQFQLWRTLLEERTGMTLPTERKSFLETSLSARMRELGLEDYQTYYAQLVTGASESRAMEWSILVDRLTVQETGFFRHPGSFALVKAFSREFARRHVNGGTLNAWSVGCSTGEEAYSLAMVINECFAGARDKLFYGITGTDISLPTLARARRGVFPLRRVNRVAPALRERYFQPHDTQHLQVTATLRERVCFAHLNVLDLDQAPMENLDLIFCQNMLIYFRRWRKRQIVNRLAARLAPGGVLVLGPGEITDWQNDNLEREVYPDTLAFRRRV
ncbi:chemotaxis protein methyltransferase [Alcanivorax xiamenensis]|uniref:protein-glutamate O-methyltransferase n=1 Tax=Alcanivorax xiamenensis TaxID=1177156 RepID=A0ABQ6YDD9_9GAMM|nr:MULTISPECIES: CheR family methyltransferase [Alcanivorax]KAF0808381.1 chemotaxis protein methyltransferase [Alcanivorax xiamenensis]